MVLLGDPGAGKMKTKWRMLALVLLSVFLVIFGITIASQTKTYHAPNWRGIIPGESTRLEVDNILGLPDGIVNRRGIQVSVYKERLDFGWKWVEIWIEPQSAKVLGVLLMIPYDANPSNNFNLIDLARAYRKPNFISWTTLGNERFFAWTDRGIAIEATISMLTQTASPDYSKIRTINAFLFEPRSAMMFKRYAWPWPPTVGWNSENLYKSGTTDAPDLYPKDPIDWDKLIK